jgi:hypothetical protein
MTQQYGPITFDPVTKMATFPGDVAVAGAVRAPNTPGGVIVPGKPPRRALQRVGVVVAQSQPTRGLVESPCIWSDAATSKLKMVYTAYDVTSGVGAMVGSIWSCDSVNGITWGNHAQFFAASGTPGAPDEKGCTGPTLMQDPDTGVWCLFYIGLTAVGYEGGVPSLCLATSPTSTWSWTRQGQILSPGGSGWRSAKVWHPYPIKWGGVWYIFINATGADGKERVGLAQSSGSLAGPWVWRDDVSPLLADQADIATFFLQSGDPCVTVDEASGIVRMDVSHASGSAGGDQYWETTIKAFPVGWVFQGYAINNTDAGATYDNQFAHKPWIHKLNGLTYHYYTAVGAVSGRQIALAIDGSGPLAAPIPVVGNQSDSGFAKSLYQQLVASGIVLDKTTQSSTLTLSDQFTRDNAALNGSAAVAGGNWTAAAGFDIVSNALVWSGSADASALLALTMPTNFYAVFDFSVISSASYPLGFYIGDPAGAFTRIYWNGAASQYGWKCVQNTGYPATIRNTAIPMGVSGRVEILKRGSNVIIRYGGDYSEFQLTVTPANKFGFAASASKGFTCSNLQLWV